LGISTEETQAALTKVACPFQFFKVREFQDQNNTNVNKSRVSLYFLLSHFIIIMNFILPEFLEAFGN